MIRLMIAVMLCAALNACGAVEDDEDQDEYARICSTSDMTVRVPDEHCGSGNPGYVWLYILVIHGIPAVHERVTHGTTAKPKAYQHKPVPAAPPKGVPIKPVQPAIKPPPAPPKPPPPPPRKP